MANKGLLPAIILVVIISVFVIGGARYLAGIIGDKQEDAGDSGAEQSEPEEKVNENVKKAGAYPSGHTEKL